MDFTSASMCHHRKQKEYISEVTGVNCQNKRRDKQSMYLMQLKAFGHMTLELININNPYTAGNGT